MKKEARSIILGFIGAVLAFAAVYFVLIHRCNVYEPNNPVPVEECKCLGKRIDINNWLGGLWDQGGYRYDSCVGFVR